MKTTIYKFILIAGCIWLTHNTQSQAQTFKATSDSYIMIKGTSTLHDWELRSENVISEVLFKMNDGGHPENLEYLTFSLNKMTLKSNQSGLDRRAYEALKANRHPELVFRMNGNSSMQQQHGDNYMVSLKGDLIIAGVTRQINVNATCLNGDDKKLICSGSQKLKMTDFQVDPPVMMLGALRTGDEITIDYRMVYTR